MRPRIISYLLITSNDESLLADDVMISLEEGFEPLGGAQVAWNSEFNRPLFSQSMVLYEDSEQFCEETDQ